MLMEMVSEVQQRRVAVRVKETGFGLLLAGVLHVWGYQVVTDPTTAGLLLTDEGCQPVAGVTLVQLGDAGGNGQLELPLQLEALWALLELRFHQPQRQHIRVALNLGVGVVGRHRYDEATLQSLSDMGGRLIYPRELVHNEGLLVRVPIDDQLVELGGKVIYCFSRGDRGEFEIGLVFTGVGSEVRRIVRHYIGRQVLAGALAQAGEGAEAGLAMFRQA